MLFGMDLTSCPDLAVPLEVMHHVVRVESSHNPFAIGVVGGHLVRQPKNLPEALATVRMLESRGFNFSLGIAQVNRYNLGKFGLDSYEKAFQVCPNLQAGSRILAECYGRSGRDWGKSFSCYYSGNFVTGFRHGYVQKIYASMQNTHRPESGSTAVIDVVSRPSRRSVGITRYPVYQAVAGTGMQRAVIAAGSLQSTMATTSPARISAESSAVGNDAAKLVSQENLAPGQVAAIDASSTSTSSIDAAFVF